MGFDCDEIELLVQKIKAGGDVGSAKASWDALRSQLRSYVFSVFSKWNLPHIKSCDFGELYESALGLAVTTFDPGEKTQFRTWCVRCLKYDCYELSRRRRKDRVGEHQEVLQRILEERAGNVDPLKSLLNREKTRILSEAMQKETMISRQVIEAWQQGWPTAQDIAVLLGKSREHIRQIRFRNLESIRRYIRNRHPND